MSEFRIGNFKYNITPATQEDFYQFGHCIFSLPKLEGHKGVQLIILSMIDPATDTWTVEFADLFPSELIAEAFALKIIENLMNNEMLVEEEEIE
jgi:hypothetical protein